MNQVYFIDGENIKLVVGDIVTIFNKQDAEGYYQAYLAWVAEGNEAQPWE